MLGIGTDKRIDAIRREIDRYRQAVDDWRVSQDEEVRYWIWEDLIARANFVFGRIMKLDLDIQKVVFRRHGAGAELTNAARDLAIVWLELSVCMRKTAEQSMRAFGAAAGYQELETNIADAEAFLTADQDFFNGDALASIRDKAIESHRAGLTEPLIDHGHATS